MDNSQIVFKRLLTYLRDEAKTIPEKVNNNGSYEAAESIEESISHIEHFVDEGIIEWFVENFDSMHQNYFEISNSPNNARTSFLINMLNPEQTWHSFWTTDKELYLTIKDKEWLEDELEVEFK